MRLRLLAASSSYSFLPITERWLSDNTPDDATETLNISFIEIVGHLSVGETALRASTIQHELYCAIGLG